MSDPAYMKAWRASNPDKVKAYHDKQKANGYDKTRYAANREKEIAEATKWRRENPEKARATRKLWDEENKEKRRKDAKKYRANTTIRNRAYRTANPKKYAAKTRAWREKYPERARITDANKKAKRKGAEGRYTSADVDNLFSQQNGICVYCPKVLTGRDYHIDHKTPLVRGGSNWPSNLQLTCPKCNLAKHKKTHDEYLQYMSELERAAA